MSQYTPEPDLVVVRVRLLPQKQNYYGYFSGGRSNVNGHVEEYQGMICARAQANDLEQSIVTSTFRIST